MHTVEPARNICRVGPKSQHGGYDSPVEVLPNFYAMVVLKLYYIGCHFDFLGHILQTPLEMKQKTQKWGKRGKWVLMGKKHEKK